MVFKNSKELSWVKDYLVLIRQQNENKNKSISFDF